MVYIAIRIYLGPCIKLTATSKIFVQASTKHLAHSKCTVAAVHNLSVKLSLTIGNVWGIFGRSHLAYLQLD